MGADNELAAVHHLPSYPSPPMEGTPGVAPDGTDVEALAVVARRVLDRLEALVPTMGDAYRREIAEYAAMEDAAFDLVLRTSLEFVRRFAAALVDGITQPAPDHAALVASGRRRQRSGVTLDAAMHAFRIASRVGWSGIADASLAVAPSLVSDLAARWIEYADRASTAFAEGHTTASSEQLRRMDARRQAMVADLLGASDELAARAVAAGHGLRLAARYVPVVVHATTADDEDRLDAAAPTGTIVGRRGSYLVALVPAEADVAALTSRLASAALGHPARPGGDLLVEVARAESVLVTARRLRCSGVHGPDDLAMHRAVHEHDGLRRHLRADVLAPLIAADGDGIFRETLRAYLAAGAVRAVADRLFVHANTVTYRLRRVRECTGLDPRLPEQAAQLVLALALEDLDLGRGLSDEPDEPDVHDPGVHDPGTHDPGTHEAQP
jgi:hypothetical protein